MDKNEQQIHDELIRRVVDLDQHRHTISLDLQDDDIITALADITDISRDEIEAIARDIRARHAHRPPFIRQLTAHVNRRFVNVLSIGIGLCLVLLVVVLQRGPSVIGRDTGVSTTEHLGSPGVSQPVNPALAAFREDFQRCCPRPSWWNRVSIKGVDIRTYDDLLRYWQNKQRSRNQFFKAAYQAILNYPEDPAIVVTAIKLMPYGDSSYPHVIPLLEFAVERYFDYRNPLANYAGKPGDAIAGIVEKLAGLYTRQQQPERALALIERLLADREKAINDHVLELLALEQATALADQGRTDDAIAVLQRAITAYHGSWEKRLRKQLAAYQ